jgi:prepilin-type N-terminal cleavage/methylation domain-containing protein
MTRTTSRTASEHHAASTRGVDFKRHPLAVGQAQRDSARGARPGFTIVELLIVVVVIAILAAITIVAYNGITNRAKESAAQATAKQALTKIQSFAVENSDAYPTEAQLSSIGLSTTSGVSYQYRVDNSVNPRTFCLTVTNNNVSYFVSNSTASPAKGSCPGHGVNGVAAVTNLAANPRATTSPGGWQTSRWFGSAPATGAYNFVVNAADGPAGITSYIRKRWDVTPSAINNSGDTGFDNTWTGSSAYQVSGGSTLTFSCFLRPSVVRNFWISLYLYLPSGTMYRVYGPQVTGPANQWTRVSFTYTIPADVLQIYPACDSNEKTANGAMNWAVNSTLDGTGLMITEGSTLYNFADGSSPGWIWNGTPNSSTSSGPPL